MIYMEARHVPIHPRIVQQLSKATIKLPIDIIVELVTNCDDSYRRLNAKFGRIHVLVERRKGGSGTIEVKDEAEGMSGEKLESVMEFGAPESGFEKGRSVRGLLGRGLKEASLSDEEGYIATVKDKCISQAHLFMRKDGAYYTIENVSEEDVRRMYKLPLDQNENGTSVKILISGRNIKLPKLTELKSQIQSIYSLREILSSNNRELELILLEKGREEHSILKYKYPPASAVCDTRFNLDDYGDDIEVKIFESNYSLSEYTGLPPPFSAYGIIVTSEGIPIDMGMFDFDNEPAMQYYYGYAECPGIARLVRESEWGILTPHRAGLDWRHEYCRRLKNEIKKWLDPLVEKKRRELKNIIDVSPEARNRATRICKLLNKLSERLLEGIETIPDRLLDSIETPVILPSKGNVPPGKVRRFSVYIPFKLVSPGTDAKASIRIEDSRIAEPLCEQVRLKPHPKSSKIAYGWFDVRGKTEGGVTTVFAELEDVKPSAVVEVREFVHKRKDKLAKERKKGLFKDIRYNPLESPPQRAVYRDGIIDIYTKFPSTSLYLQEDGEYKSEMAGVALAEILSEVFCRTIARKWIEDGIRPVFPGSEIDTFNATVNELQTLALQEIHLGIRRIHKS